MQIKSRALNTFARLWRWWNTPAASFAAAADHSAIFEGSTTSVAIGSITSQITSAIFPNQSHEIKRKP